MSKETATERIEEAARELLALAERASVITPAMREELTHSAALLRRLAAERDEIQASFDQMRGPQQQRESHSRVYRSVPVTLNNPHGIKCIIADEDGDHSA